MLLGSEGNNGEDYSLGSDRLRDLCTIEEPVFVCIQRTEDDEGGMYAGRN